MSLIPPSINMVMLSGILQSEPKRSVSADGGSMVEIVVATGVEGRTIKHSVRVLDPALSDAAMASLVPGMIVSVTGELDYDATGSFVAVLARRACDLRFAGVSDGDLLAPSTVQSSTKMHVEVSSPAPTLRSPPPRSTPVTASQPDPAPVEADDANSESAAPVEEAPSAVAEVEPVVDAQSKAPTLETTSPVSAPRRMGLGIGGSKPAVSVPASSPKPASAPARMGLSGLRSSSSMSSEAPDEPPSSDTTRATSRPNASAAQSGFSRPQVTRQAPAVGPDMEDDDIPF